MGATHNELAVYKAQCAGSATPLQAIGTDAAACAIDTKGDQKTEQVAGRVRKQAFLIRLTAAQNLSREMLREKTVKVAEQVAGNLF